MADEQVRKRKVLALIQLLYEKTDQLHALSKREIIAELAALDVPAERKSIKRDFDLLREFGIEVAERREGRSTVHWIEDRTFTLEQMIWLVDAVQSCPSLTEETTDEIIERIKRMASKSQRKLLEKRIDVIDRGKTGNENVFANLDMLQQCFRKERVAKFKYFSYGTSGEREYRYHGMTYTATPVRLVYTDGRYYFVGWDDAGGRIRHYRVDRMSDVVCSEEPAVKNRTILDYDPANMAPVQFGMWGEKLRGVTMVVDKEAVNIVKDKFGDKVTYTPIDGNKCRVHGMVAVGPVFYAWVAMFSNRMKILKPPSVIEGYKDYLRECMEPYEDD